ncbi:MAG: sugar ABC transporter permease, partial [Clostridia bacterium]|nr:sugar ABC transporter permease [Clostridia bacterium]
MIEDRITVKNALINGDLLTKLSAVVMGAGIAGHKQIIKGAVVLLLEIAFWVFMISQGFHNLSMLPSLGTEVQGKVWNEAKQIYEYAAGDNSQQILLFGVITCFVVAGFIGLWVLQLLHSYKLQKEMKKGEAIPNLRQDVKNLLDGNLHITLMTLPCIGILVFNIVPLVYMITMAFTTYSKEG